MTTRDAFQRLCRAGLVGIVLGTPLAQSEPVADPTRPAGALLNDMAAVRPDAAARAAKPASAVAATPTAAPRLQAVQIRAQGPASALLDGRVLRVGERVGEQTVVAIDAAGLTLRGPRGEQRLSLISGVTKTASRAMPEPTQALATGTP